VELILLLWSSRICEIRRLELQVCDSYYFLSAICGKLAAMRITGLPHYLITGALQGACETATNPPTHLPLSVQALLDTKTVQDNYCSETVGNWVREHSPQSWRAAGEEKDVDLACLGTSARPSCICHINLRLVNEQGSTVCILINLKATVLDLGIDFIVGRYTIYFERLVNAIPDYFSAPQHPSTVTHTNDALLALPQTRDEADQLSDPTQQPAKPAGR
jgi:hypothetical protein